LLPEVNDVIMREGIYKNFEYLGYLGQREVAALQKKSDLLLLIQECSPPYEEYIISKFWDYVASRRPILSIAAENCLLSKIIEASNLGITTTDPNMIFKYLMKMLSKKDNNDFKPNLSEIKEFSRTRYLSKIKNSLDFL
jgi:hypothetical protein